MYFRLNYYFFLLCCAVVLIGRYNRSVHSPIWTCNSKTKWCRKTKIGVNIRHGRTAGVPNVLGPHSRNFPKTFSLKNFLCRTI